MMTGTVGSDGTRKMLTWRRWTGMMMLYGSSGAGRRGAGSGLSEARWDSGAASSSASDDAVGDDTVKACRTVVTGSLSSELKMLMPGGAGAAGLRAGRATRSGLTASTCYIMKQYLMNAAFRFMLVSKCIE